MGVFRLAEAQRARQRIDGGDGGADRASLFQPDVPVDADACEFGYLLASEARGAAPSPKWKTNRLGAQLFAPRPEEIAKFTALRIRHHLHLRVAGIFSHPRAVRQGLCSPRIIT